MDYNLLAKVIKNPDTRNILLTKLRKRKEKTGFFA